MPGHRRGHLLHLAHHLQHAVLVTLRIGDTGLGGLLHLFDVLPRRERLGELHRRLRIEVLPGGHGHQLFGGHPRLLVEGFLLQTLHLALVVQIHLLVLAVDLLDLAQTFDLGVHLGVIQLQLRLTVGPHLLALLGAAVVGVLVLPPAVRQRQLLQFQPLTHRLHGDLALARRTDLLEFDLVLQLHELDHLSALVTPLGNVDPQILDVLFAQQTRLFDVGQGRFDLVLALRIADALLARKHGVELIQLVVGQQTVLVDLLQSLI